MNTKEKAQFWRNSQLDLELMQAYFFQHAYPRHSHDHYVICLVEHGVQSFTLKGTKYYTPPRGLIFINPGVIHTGEPATDRGFHLRSLYPSVELMQTAVFQLIGRQNHIPFFHLARVDDAEMAAHFCRLHETLKNEPDPLICEAEFISTMQKMIVCYADVGEPKRWGSPKKSAIQQVRDYLEANFAHSVTLADLAQVASLSPYHLLRTFHAEVGAPPHAYLLNVRIQQAQKLIGQNLPLADIASSVGFNSQSHMTRHFKQFVGITPGQYARAFSEK